MELSPNSLFLIRTLETLPVLDGRYTQIKCVNVNIATGSRKGVLSLVFKAFDQADQRHVALKFYDIDPYRYFDQYRNESFRREHAILQSIQGARRCLQVVSNYVTYMLQIPQPTGHPLSLACPYFAVEWIDQELDTVFETQDTQDSLTKLQLFYDIVLAVEALHRHNVYHRDLKKDNLRVQYEGTTQLVVAIDLGTAARADSPALLTTYDDIQVGAPAYTAPEAMFMCGLAGCRQIARFTDIYALGCMLFELFNKDLFARELLVKNPNYQTMLTVMSVDVRSALTPELKLSRWHNVLRKHAKGLAPISILVAGNSVPAGIALLLDELVQHLTNFDYRKRPKSLEYIRLKIRSTIICLSNEREYQRRLEKARKTRADRISRIAEREKRLALSLRRRIKSAN